MIPKNPVISLVAQATGTVLQPVRLDGGNGVLVQVNITGNSGTTPTLTVTIQGVSEDGAGTVYTILASTALDATVNGVVTLTVYPGAAATANVSANAAVPSDIQIKAVVGGTTPTVTATISVITLK